MASSQHAKAISQKCLDCCGGSVAEVQKCHLEDCPLWPYRFANKRIGDFSPGHGKPGRLKACAMKCRECTGQGTAQAVEIRDCDADCAIKPYRFGRKPK